MQTLNGNIHIEDKYAGVTLGAINLPEGLIFIDAPISPEDSRSWRTDLLDLECGSKRLLVNLDTNLDRIIGARAMDATIIAHENLADFLQNRSGAIKTQGQGGGAIWENIPTLGNRRWASPQIRFTQGLSLHWGESPLIMEHHPITDSGAIWIILPKEKIIFVGDAIVKEQPPFLANANLPLLFEDLKKLRGEKYENYTIISGRGGICNTETIEKQQKFLTELHQKLKNLSQKGASPEKTTTLIPDLLDHFQFNETQKETYTQRLQHGLSEIYRQRYLPPIPEEN